MLILKIFIGLLGISIIVFIHELGHFAFAKLFKVQVETFSVGMGKRLFGVNYKGTDYRVSMLPIGGYCKMKGQDDLAKEIDAGDKGVPPEPGSFYHASAWKRILILFAGPGFNFISAVLIFLVLFQIGVIGTKNIIDVAELENGTSPAIEAGLKAGDQIIMIDGKQIFSFNDVISAVKDKKEEISLLILRGDQELELKVTPQFDNETSRSIIGIKGLITIGNLNQDSAASKSGIQNEDTLYLINGVEIDDFYTQLKDFYNIEKESPTITVIRDGEFVEIKTVRTFDENEHVDYFFGTESINLYLKMHDIPTGEAFKLAFTKPLSFIKENFIGLYSIITGQNKEVYSKEDLGGPLSIIGGIGGNFTELGKSNMGLALYDFFSTLAILSLILGVMNLLPIPALDGGHIVISIVEIVMRKRPSTKFLVGYQMVGLFIILLLTIFVLKTDISNIINRGGF
ncbi:MAG: RIP metalloprotease RseP [Spirochaetales bacterium]|nr:RIP metalloprotease RseP [Spirochaetales bacterium]